MVDEVVGTFVETITGLQFDIYRLREENLDLRERLALSETRVNYFRENIDRLIIRAEEAIHETPSSPTPPPSPPSPSSPSSSGSNDGPIDLHVVDREPERTETDYLHGGYETNSTEYEVVNDGDYATDAETRFSRTSLRSDYERMTI